MANEKAMCIVLVSEVEKYELLYNYKLPEYSRNDLTEKAWAEVANKTKLTVSECKEKWRNIRSTFIRSTKPPPSGSKTKKPYYLAEYLTFILPYVKPASKIPDCGNIPPNPEEDTVPDTETAGNIEAEPGEQILDEGPTDSSEQPETSNIQVPSAASTPVPRRRKAASAEVDSAMVKFLKYKTNRTDESILNGTEKRMNHFFLSLLPEFSDMSAQQIRSFKIGVLQLIDDIKTGPMPGRSRNSSSSRETFYPYSPVSVSTTAPNNLTPASEPPQPQVINYQFKSLPDLQTQEEAVNFSVVSYLEE